MVIFLWTHHIFNFTLPCYADRSPNFHVVQQDTFPIFQRNSYLLETVLAFCPSHSCLLYICAFSLAERLRDKLWLLKMSGFLKNRQKIKAVANIFLQEGLLGSSAALKANILNSILVLQLIKLKKKRFTF